MNTLLKIEYTRDISARERKVTKTSYIEQIENQKLERDNLHQLVHKLRRMCFTYVHTMP